MREDCFSYPPSPSVLPICAQPLLGSKEAAPISQKSTGFPEGKAAGRPKPGVLDNDHVGGYRLDARIPQQQSSCSNHAESGEMVRRGVRCSLGDASEGASPLG